MKILINQYCISEPGDLSDKATNPEGMTIYYLAIFFQNRIKIGPVQPHHPSLVSYNIANTLVICQYSDERNKSVEKQRYQRITLKKIYPYTPSNWVSSVLFFLNFVSFIKNFLLPFCAHSGVAACYDELMIYKYPLDDAAVKALSG